MNKEEYGYINALKGLAILAVTMVHTGASDLPGIWGRIGNNGARGVQLFFVISGMLTFRSLSGYFPDRKLTLASVGKWYLSRYIRIAPMYYISLALSMLTGSWSAQWLGTEGHVTIQNILAHVFLIHGLFPHYTNSILSVDWYLGCLWIFILLSPILFYYIDSLEKSVILAIIVYVSDPILSMGLSYLLPVGSDPTIYNMYIGYFSPFTQLLVYVTGIVMFFMIGYIQGKEVKCKRILSYTLLFFSVILMYGQAKGAGTIYLLSPPEMFGLFFGIMVLSQSVYASVLIDNPFFRLFGKYSYGMYLFQFIWLDFYHKYINRNGTIAWILDFLISVCALLLISFLFTRFYEKPVRGKLNSLI